MKLSIIVPVYNIEKYVAECIESILKQSFKDFEVILVDDGSTDKSGSICDAYLERDPRVRVIHQQNQGLVAARKTGVQAAKGQYVGFVDGDDWIEPNMYSLLMEQIDAGCDLAICDMYYDYPSRVVEYHNANVVLAGSTKPQLINTAHYFEFLISPNTVNKVYRRSDVMTIQSGIHNNITLGEDTAITFPYFSQVDRIGFVHECCYHYRQNSTSMTRRYNKNLSKSVELLFEHLENSLSREFMEEIELYRYFMAILVLKNEVLGCQSSRELKNKLHELMQNDFIAKPIAEIKLPKPKLFDYLLDISLKNKMEGFTVLLLRVWKKHVTI